MAEASAATPAAPPPRTTKLLLVLVAVNLLAVTGLGGYFVYRQHFAPQLEAQGARGGEADAEGEAKQKGAGPIVAMAPLVTNLAAPDTDRYLKITIQLRVASDQALGEVDAALVPIRSQFLLYLSSLTVDDLVGADQKRELQEKLKGIANEALSSSPITHVYFTEFVTQ
jgi:flagellar FliL protein